MFASKDDRPILISIQSDREWRSLCKGVLGDAGAERPQCERELERHDGTVLGVFDWLLASGRNSLR